MRSTVWFKGLFSAAAFARAMDSLTDALAVVVASVVRNLGTLFLLLADAFAGGYVLNKTLAGGLPPMWVTILAICWSAGTSAILMSLWEAALSDGIRGTRPVPLIFALLVTVVDGIIDVKIVTILQFNVEVAANTWFIPAGANPMWWLKFWLAVLMTSFGELGIVFLRSMRRRARLTAAADAAALIPAVPVPATA